MSTDNLESFMKVIQCALDNIQDITEETIDKTIDYFKRISKYKELTDIQVQKLKKEIQS